MRNRPFDNYRTAIDDPEFFVGRGNLLKHLRENSRSVHVLLGGRRIGKTSTLRAIEWSMLELPPDGPDSPFPVLVNLQAEQPRSADHFRHLLIARLRNALGRYLHTRDQIWKDWRTAYRDFVGLFDEVKIEPYFLKLKLKAPADALNPESFRVAIQDSIDDLRKSGFRGVLFLLDEAEVVTRMDWGDSAFSHIRGFKDTDPLKAAVGFVFSGFRGIRDYRQKVGSALTNIAEPNWMASFDRKTADLLVARRFAGERETLREGDEDFLWEYSGGHPLILQQTISTLIDVRREGDSALEVLPRRFRHDLNHVFRDWWNSDGKSDGLTERERTVYEHIPDIGRMSLDDLLGRLEIKEMPLQEALEVLCGSGIVREALPEEYEISGRLFRTWTQSQ